jgi:ABC-type glycerol-3-phosphate transport system substrate-binding protein
MKHIIICFARAKTAVNLHSYAWWLGFGCPASRARVGQVNTSRARDAAEDQPGRSQIMTPTKMTALATAMVVLSGTTAMAGCGITAGNVSILSNDFPALNAVAAGAMECAGDGVTVTANQTTEHRDLQVAALTANPAQYTTAVVANSSIVPLLSAGLIRPLDDLVAEHGAGLKPTQLITIDGQIMAIAFMANAQHLFYRSDILAEVGLDAPTTYEEVLAAA